MNNEKIEYFPSFPLDLSNYLVILIINLRKLSFFPLFFLTFSVLTTDGKQSACTNTYKKKIYIVDNNTT